MSHHHRPRVASRPRPVGLRAEGRCAGGGHETTGCPVNTGTSTTLDERKRTMYERMNPHKVAPELQKPMFGLTQHIAGNIDPTLFELIKLYASMLNGCAHCIDIHSSDALEGRREHGPTVRSARLVRDAVLHRQGTRRPRPHRGRDEVRSARCARRGVRGRPNRVRRPRADLCRRRHRPDQHVEPLRRHLPAHPTERCRAGELRAPVSRWTLRRSSGWHWPSGPACSASPTA